MSDPERPKAVYPINCNQCGGALELPSDLTEVAINCPTCGAANVLAPALIQARQRQYDLQALAFERTRQVEQQRMQQQRVLAARQSASRRTTIVIWILILVFLGLPALAVGSLVVFGLAFGKKSIQEMGDARINGMPAMSSEIQKKQSEGCQRIVLAPAVRMGGAGTFEIQLKGNGPCAHLMGATSVTSAELTLEQSSHYPLTQKLPEPAQVFDYRLCAPADHDYVFSVRSSQAGPFTTAAMLCPRTVAEGLVRSTAGDPVTTAVAVARDWAEQQRAKGCRPSAPVPSAVEGAQILDVESAKGGPCFNLLVASHFADAPLTVKLTSPSGKTIAEPAPATRVQLEYCPSDTGKHQIEIVPSTKDHYAMATVDCPRTPRRAPQNAVPQRAAPQKAAPQPAAPLLVR